jgi:hypothetical protein
VTSWCHNPAQADHFLSNLQRSVKRSMDKRKPQPKDLLVRALMGGQSDDALALLAQDGDNTDEKKTKKKTKALGADDKVLGGWRPLHVAAYSGHAAMVELLLGAGADQLKEDGMAMRPIHIAALEGHSESVKLLDAKLSQFSRNSTRGQSVKLLHQAVLAGYAQDAAQLVTVGGASIEEVSHRTGSVTVYGHPQRRHACAACASYRHSRRGGAPVLRAQRAAGQLTAASDRRAVQPPARASCALRLRCPAAAHRRAPLLPAALRRTPPHSAAGVDLGLGLGRAGVGERVDGASPRRLPGEGHSDYAPTLTKSAAYQVRGTLTTLQH